jgi:hypothetical protein
MIDSVIGQPRSVSLGVSRGRARRLSLGAAITFAVAVIAGVVGGRLTGHITPALGVFAALLVAGMMLSYWLDRSTRTSDRKDSGGSGGATATRAVTDLRGAEQNIIASGPAAKAWGAMGGDVIIYGDVMRPHPAASNLSDSSQDEQDGRS